jgi:DNA-binding XRE family transcriptional regulator
MIPLQTVWMIPLDAAPTSARPFFGFARRRGGQDLPTHLCVGSDTVDAEGQRGTKHNLVKEFREKRGLSQRKLAEKAETYQQQIQRIEAGVQVARLDLAVKIATALGAPLEAIFPKSQTHKGAFGDLAESPIELDGALRTIMYRLRGGFEGLLAVSLRDWERVKSILHHYWGGGKENDRNPGFVVFDSQGQRVAINLSHLLYARFLFDPHGKMEEQADDSGRARFFLSDGATLEAGIEPEGEGEDGERVGQFQRMFAYLDLDGAQNHPVLSFVDEDEERAFVAADAVSMISVSLHCVEPKLWDAIYEGRDAEEDA